MAKEATGPLAGVRVLDFTQIIAGPFATQILADQGADVIKVEKIDGVDPTRSFVPQLAPGTSAMYVNVNRNKRSIAVDTRKLGSVDLLLRLVAKCDVVFQNFRPGAMDRMGLGYEACKKVKPDIIYVSSSGFGEVGPLADQKVYDPLIQGLAGYADTQRDYATGDFHFVQGPICDKVTAMTSAQAVTAALFAKAQGRGGTHVKLSMLQSALAFNFVDAMMNHVSLRENPPQGPEIGMASRPYPTKDGGKITIGVASDKDIAAFCRAVAPELLDDPKFFPMTAMYENMLYAIAKGDEVCAKYDQKDLLERLQAQDVPCAPLNRVADLFNDPQVTAIKAFSSVEHPVAGPIRLVEHPAQFEGMPAKIDRWHAPSAGEQTEELLREVLGAGDAEVRALRDQGVIASSADMAAKSKL